MNIPNKPKIKLSNFLYVIDDKIKIIGNNNYLKRFQKKQNISLDKVAKRLGISKRIYRYCIRGLQNPTLRFLKKLSKEDKNILRNFFNSDIAFSARSMVVNLPKYLTPELSYFIGYLQGDGYVTSDKKTYGFADEYLNQLYFINKLNKKIFGNKGYIRMKKSWVSGNFCSCLEIRQYVVNSYLHHFWKQTRGRKTNIKVPPIFYKSKKIMRWYIMGLFDAEGTLPRNPKKVKQPFIDLSMKNKKFVEEIKFILKSVFEINTLKLYPRISKSLPIDKETLTWEIRIRKHSEIKKFLKTVGFHHKDKRMRALKLIKLLPE